MRAKFNLSSKILKSLSVSKKEYVILRLLNQKNLDFFSYLESFVYLTLIFLSLIALYADGYKILVLSLFA